MVNPEIIRNRLQALEAYLADMEKILQSVSGSVVEDRIQYRALERLLQLSVEATIDSGAHIVSDQAWGSIERARDIPEIFFEKGIIDEKLRDTWRKMIGFRNLLVHDYLKTDPARVEEIAKKNRADFQSLAKKFAGFL